jgi:hypothetical protein
MRAASPAGVPFIDRCSHDGPARDELVRASRTSPARTLLSLASDGEPATGVVALPPPTRRPTPLRLPDGSRPGGLDCAPRVRVITRAWEGPGAACRLLQSMTIREHNCSTVRTPRTAVVVAHGGSSCRGWLRALRLVANRGLTGQGPRRDEPSLAPPAVIAHGGASPQPDRLGHLLSRARGAGAGVALVAGNR